MLIEDKPFTFVNREMHSKLKAKKEGLNQTGKLKRIVKLKIE